MSRQSIEHELFELRGRHAGSGLPEAAVRSIDQTIAEARDLAQPPVVPGALDDDEGTEREPRGAHE